MKFSGKVGFWIKDIEKSPGMWEPEITERQYTGTVLENIRRFQNESKQNGDLALDNQISILSDLYARDNWMSIKYVEWNGVRWKVSSVHLSYPRIILQLGGVYNGPFDRGNNRISEEVH